MTHKASNGARKSVQIGEQKVLRGEGGETHQISGGDVPHYSARRTGCGRSEFPEDWLTRTNIVEEFHFRDKIFHFDSLLVVLHLFPQQPGGCAEHRRSITDLCRVNVDRFGQLMLCSSWQAGAGQNDRRNIGNRWIRSIGADRHSQQFIRGIERQAWARNLRQAFECLLSITCRCYRTPVFS